MNTWIKGNGQFESDDALETFVGQAKALIIMTNLIDRFTY